MGARNPELITEEEINDVSVSAGIQQGPIYEEIPDMRARENVLYVRQQQLGAYMNYQQQHQRLYENS